MRERETHINIRTTPKEKAQFERKASKCGLSLSAYIRMLANGHEPKAVPPLEYGDLCQLLSDLYTDFRDSGDTKYADWLIGVLTELQAALLPERKGGDKTGNHKNMGDQGQCPQSG